MRNLTVEMFCYSVSIVKKICKALVMEGTREIGYTGGNVLIQKFILVKYKQLFFIFGI